MTSPHELEELTIGVLTRDSADLLPGLLATLPAGAELVIVDGASRDRTVQLARAAGARVVPQDLEEIRRHGGNFDLARNQVTRHASRPWLLFLDADERLTPALGAELRAVLAAPGDAAGFDIPRINLYWGRPVRALGADLQRRLVRRGHGSFRGSSLHSRMEVDGPVARLENPLIHLNVRSWRDVSARFRQRVDLDAAAQPRRPSAVELLRGPWALFRYYYLTNQARRDGVRGLAVSLIYAAQHGAALWRRRTTRHA